MKLIGNIGTFLDKLKGISNTIENNHSYRYVKLVAISDLGEDCRYARASEKLWLLDQKHADLKLLEELKQEIELILEQAKEHE